MFWSLITKSGSCANRGPHKCKRLKRQNQRPGFKTSRGCTNIKTILGIKNQRGRTLGWCLGDIMTIRFAPSDGHFLEISTARFSKHRLGTTAPMLEEENSAVQQQHPLGTSKTTPQRVQCSERVSLVIWRKTIWSKRKRDQVLTRAQILFKFLTLHSFRRGRFWKASFCCPVRQKLVGTLTFMIFFFHFFCFATTFDQHYKYTPSHSSRKQKYSLGYYF